MQVSGHLGLVLRARPLSSTSKYISIPSTTPSLASLVARDGGDTHARRDISSYTRPVYSTTTEMPFEGVSEDISKLIYDHAHQPHTSVSLQALMRTGRGEFLHKTFEDTTNIDQHSATELVLIQVR